MKNKIPAKVLTIITQYRVTLYMENFLKKAKSKDKLVNKENVQIIIPKRL